MLTVIFLLVVGLGIIYLFFYISYSNRELFSQSITTTTILTLFLSHVVWPIRTVVLSWRGDVSS